MKRLNFLNQEQQLALAPTLSLIDEFYGDSTRRFSSRLSSEHLFDVAKHLARFEPDIDLINSALLHDIVEDHPQSNARVYYCYNDRVNRIVALLTKPKRNANQTREERNTLYWTKLSKDSDALLIKLCDTLSNCPVGEETDDFCTRFIAEKSRFLEVVREAAFKKANTQTAFIELEAGINALRESPLCS